MNRKLAMVLLVIGVVMIMAGIVLPPEKIVRAVLPSSKPEFFEKLLAGMRCLKAVLVLDGLVLVGLRWLKRWLWDAGPNLPAQPPRRFFVQAPIDAWDRRDVWIVVGLSALALGLRLVGSQQSLFGDEIAVQQRYINRGLPVIFTFFAHGTPPHVMYSVLAFFTERLPLPFELAYRLPALLFGTGAVALTYFVARRVFDRFIGTVVGLLSATALYGIVYSHNAKGYSATHFFVLLAIVAMIRLADDWRAPGGWVSLCVAGAGMVWMHLYNVYLWTGIVVMFGLVLVWLTSGDWRLTRAWLCRAVFALGITGLTLALVYALQIPQIRELFSQVADKPEEHISLNSLRGWLMQLTFWGHAWPVALACAVLAGLGVFSLARREPRLALVLVFPAVFVWAMIFLKGTWIYPRYLVFTLPTFLILLVEGGRRLGGARSQVAVLVVAVLFLIPNTQALRRYYSVGNQNIRAGVRLITTSARPTDIIVSYGLARDLFPFYNSAVKPVTTLEELQRILAQPTGDVYLLYGWRKAWRGRAKEFDFIDQQFTVVQQYDGLLMDSTEPDGTVVVARAIAKTR